MWTRKGQPLDGSKTYRLHLPPHIPAKNFWSLVPYDNQTRSMLQTDQQFPSIGSQKAGIIVNPDTSVDVYFGPKAPEGLESNWIPTEGRKPAPFMRIYDGDERFWSKTFTMPDVERVE